MGLFTKKEINMVALQHFWRWFAQQETWIKENLPTNGMDVVWAIDAQIKPVFPYFKKELEFQLGYNDGTGEFFFFHFNNKYLKRDAEIFRNAMPAELAVTWSVILDA